MDIFIQIIQISSTLLATVNLIFIIIYLSLAEFRTDTIRVCFLTLTCMQPGVYYFIYLYRIIQQVQSHHRTVANKTRLLLAGNALIVLYIFLAEFKLLYTRLSKITELESRWFYLDKWEKFVINTCLPIMIHVVIQALPQAVLALTNHDTQLFDIEVGILVTSCGLWLTGVISVFSYIISKRIFIL